MLKGLISLFLASILIFSLSSCETQEYNNLSSNDILNFESKEKETTSDGTSSLVQEGNVSQFYRQFNPACIFSPEEEVLNDDFSISNITLELTKEFPQEFDKEKILEIFISDFESNDVKKIMSNHLYLLLTFDVKNTLNSERKVYINGLGSFSVIDETYKEVKRFFNEPIYYSKNTHNLSDKDFWAVDFKKNENKTITVVYIFSESDIEGQENLFFVVGNSSISDKDNKNTTKAFRLEIK